MAADADNMLWTVIATAPAFGFRHRSID